MSVQSSLPSLLGRFFFGASVARKIQVEVGQDDPRHRSSVVEHTLGKGEVTGSSPVGGLEICFRCGRSATVLAEARENEELVPSWNRGS